MTRPRLPDGEWEPRSDVAESDCYAPAEGVVEELDPMFGQLPEPAV